MKNVQAFSSARKSRESSFHHCGGPVQLVNPVYVRERPQKQPRSCYEPCAGPFMFQERATKQFSPLWRSCVSCSTLFVCGKDLRKSF